jgi:hypothetical protein
MKRILLALSLAAGCLHAQVPADGLPADIAASVQKHGVMIKSLDLSKHDEIERLRKGYLDSISSQEKSAGSRGSLDESAGLLKIRQAVEKGIPDADPPAGISPRQLKEFRGFLDGIDRIEESFSPKYDQVNSDYLKALAAGEQRLPADSPVRQKIADLKQALVTDAPAGGSRTLTTRHFNNTEWYWLEGKAKVWRFLPAGKLVTESGEASHFGWRITGPQTFIITAGGADLWSFTMDFDKMRASGTGVAKDKILTYKGRARKQ